MSTNSFVDDCPECDENTCLNNVSTRPPYHNLECWSCGWFSIAETGRWLRWYEERRKEMIDSLNTVEGSV